MFSTCFTSLSVLLLFPLLITFFLCTVFDSIPSKIDEVLSINPSVNVFVFGDFNVHHKNWFTYSGDTDRSGEVCYNFSISNEDVSEAFGRVWHTGILHKLKFHGNGLRSSFLSSRWLQMVLNGKSSQ